MKKIFGEIPILFFIIQAIFFFFGGSSSKEDNIIRIACYNSFELVKEVDDCINTAKIEKLFVKKEFKNE